MAVRLVLVVELDDPTGQRGPDEIEAYGEAVCASMLSENGPELITFEAKRGQIRAAHIERDR